MPNVLWDGTSEVDYIVDADANGNLTTYDANSDDFADFLFDNNRFGDASKRHTNEGQHFGELHFRGKTLSIMLPLTFRFTN